ncbi:helix-turn-helix transcriptional regulator [Clostridium baratii]|uniref:helix-turn-helix domain-containing protein n=1 Tax=Clostridium baratii TaxID=1561 RepID=UPI0030D35EC4
MKIGDKIKNLRIQKNISQKDFAKQLNIPVSTLANYENNHREPKLETLSNIATALEISLSDLLNKENKTLTNKLIELCDKTVCKHCDAENTLELICELIDIDIDYLNECIKNNKDLSESYLINIIDKIYMYEPFKLLLFFEENNNLIDNVNVYTHLKNILFNKNTNLMKNKEYILKLTYLYERLSMIKSTTRPEISDIENKVIELGLNNFKNIIDEDTLEILIRGSFIINDIKQSLDKDCKFTRETIDIYDFKYFNIPKDKELKLTIELVDSKY